jgi:hypothetical protein
MNLAELLAELESLGVSIVRDGDQMRCEGSGEPLPAELRQEVQGHRAELVEALSRCGWCQAPLTGPVRDSCRVVREGRVSYLCSGNCVFEAWPWREEFPHREFDARRRSAV